MGETSGTPPLAFKILTDEQRTVLLTEEIFSGAPVDLADGYIHLSSATQVAETLDKHFSGQTGLHIAAVDLATLGNTVRWEESRGGQLFPHIYGPLPLSSIGVMIPVERTEDGSVILPPLP